MIRTKNNNIKLYFPRFLGNPSMLSKCTESSLLEAVKTCGPEPTFVEIMYRNESGSCTSTSISSNLT